MCSKHVEECNKYVKNKEFVYQVGKKKNYHHEMRPVGAELFHEDKRTVRQTDGHDEANSRFSKFRERAKNKDPYFYRRFVVKLMY